MAHDDTHAPDRRSPRRRTWPWLAAAAAGLFSLGLAVPAGDASYASGSSHSGGSNFVFSDGSVRFVSSSTGSWMFQILPFIEQDNIVRSTPTISVVNFVMGDGSVRSVQSSTDIAAWQALGTRAGGEIVSDG